MTDRINKSWREQRKAVLASNSLFTVEYKSLWEASQTTARRAQCTQDTARKEIKKAIKTGKPRYGYLWRWKD